MSRNNDDDPANADFILRHDPTMTSTSSDDSALIERRLRLHRIVPLVAGVLVPFSIILNIPALTGPWLVVGGEGVDVGMEESSGMSVTYCGKEVVWWKGLASRRCFHWQFI